MDTLEHEITRQIGIDAGHRVPFHGSKCRHLHGHRYTIEATCRGKLIAAGEQSGMVLDFGFLKDEMMSVIDAPADHAMLIWRGDELLPALQPLCGKLLVVPCIPTAENLAAYWFEKLAERVRIRSEGNAYLSRIRVHETPNCFADYPLRPEPIKLPIVGWQGRTEMQLPPKDETRANAFLLIDTINQALKNGVKHYAKSGRALTTALEIIEALNQDGAIDFEPATPTSELPDCVRELGGCGR